MSLVRIIEGDCRTALAELDAGSHQAGAARRGLDTRIGLEDTSHEPDGRVTTGNEALVRAARALVESSAA